MKLFLGRLVLILLLLAFWEFAAATFADEFFISRPTVVAQKFWELAASGRLFFHGGITAVETLAGFVAGAATGILVGLLLGRNELGFDRVGHRGFLLARGVLALDAAEIAGEMLQLVTLALQCLNTPLQLPLEIV